MANGLNFRIAILIWMMILGTSAIYAQNTREVESPKKRNSAVRYSSKKKSGNFFSRLFGKNQNNQEGEVEAFRERMEEVYQEKAKQQRKMADPQYTDPLYFGHKRPPKKRPEGKKKFCKECGMSH